MDQTENSSESSRPGPIFQLDLGTMTLQDFKTWSTNALKCFMFPCFLRETYLSLQNEQNEGSFEELASR